MLFYLFNEAEQGPETKMDELLKKVSERLNLEIEICEALLFETEKEREAIIQSDIETVNAICSKKQALLERMNRLGEERDKLKPALVKQFEIDPGEFSLTNLSELIKEPYSSEIHANCRRIKKLIEKVNAANRANAALLENSLELVRSALDLLNDSSAGGGMYGPGGKILNEEKQGRFISETC